jgi:signal transduction histidine kinase
MKLHFRLKIALLSLSVSGALLASFGAAFWFFTYSSGIERLDREIRSIVDPSLRGERTADYWKEFGDSLKFIYGETRIKQIALLVAGSENHILFQTANAPKELAFLPRPELPHSIKPNSASARFQTLEANHRKWRVGTFRNPQVTIVAAMDMNGFLVDIHRFRRAFFIAVPLGLLLLGLTGWFLASRAMRPIAIMANTAEGITAQGLDQRIPMVGNDSELERLVSVTNGMLDRLEKSYHQAVRFSADAAHELQTPLTILQGELDNAIQTAPTGSPEQQRYSMLLEELRNLKTVVQKLLLLAHADEGRLELSREPVDLSELARTAAEDIELMAPTLKIETHIDDKIILSADPALLNQTIRNMTSNAAKYATTPGQVTLLLKQDSNQIQFTLSNTAAPIPPEDQALLFDRFHRVDKARTAAGSGLGLSLAREIARAHNGDLVLNPYLHGQVSFTLWLPTNP